MTTHTYLKEIPINLIQFDTDFQARVQMDPETVQEYADDMADGAIFPPPEVYTEGENKLYYLSDGFHRVAAYIKLGKDSVLARVAEGSRRDAMLAAIAANTKHGLKRSRADKRRAVEMLLRDDEWRGWSDRAIGRWAAVSHKTVGKYRAELETTGEIPSVAQRKTAAGKTMDTTNVGSNQPSTHTPPPKFTLKVDMGVSYLHGGETKHGTIVDIQYNRRVFVIQHGLKQHTVNHNDIVEVLVEDVEAEPAPAPKQADTELQKTSKATAGVERIQFPWLYDYISSHPDDDVNPWHALYRSLALSVFSDAYLFIDTKRGFLHISDSYTCNHIISLLDEKQKYHVTQTEHGCALLLTSVLKLEELSRKGQRIVVFKTGNDDLDRFTRSVKKHRNQHAGKPLETIGQAKTCVNCGIRYELAEREQQLSYCDECYQEYFSSGWQPSDDAEAIQGEVEDCLIDALEEVAASIAGRSMPAHQTMAHIDYLLEQLPALRERLAGSSEREFEAAS